DVILVVLAAALLHASWNAMAKGRGGGDPLIGSVVIAIGAATVSLGTLAIAGLPSVASLPFAVASGIIHVGYFVLLGLSYRNADYTAIYPLMRGSAPLITTMFGFALLGERLTLPMLGGVLLVSAGVLGLGANSLLRGGLDRKSLTIAAGNVAIIVLYTLVDGIGARRSGNAISYASLMMVLTGVLLTLTVGAIRPRDISIGLRSRWLFSLAGGAMVMASYGAALWAMTRAPIGTVAALRETSVLFGSLIGAFVMGERLSFARGLASATIFAGLACMRLI
ncbi:MAG: EamA family transporter, partial [Proteobacteria bacterium]|nr:EamA family transporter [Pseudomonadota bacterium]